MNTDFVLLDDLAFSFNVKQVWLLVKTPGVKEVSYIRWLLCSSLHEKVLARAGQLQGHQPPALARQAAHQLLRGRMCHQGELHGRVTESSE